MSFHQDFHETKRGRKYYFPEVAIEAKKQKALRYLDHTIQQFEAGLDSKDYKGYGFLTKLQNLEKLVNDI